MREVWVRQGQIRGVGGRRWWQRHVEVDEREMEKEEDEDKGEKKNNKKKNLNWLNEK